MFAALKYHSTDYLYESMARQKFSIWRLSLCFPPCLHQDEKYHLTGLFADDKYRKPWTRITSTQNMIGISVLDQWKKSLSVEDFLEKKPTASVEFCISNELIEVIPSSNPCSQTDIEGPLLLTKNVFKEESTQDKYLKSDYATEFKEQWQDLYIEDELVFVDNLENFRKNLPTSSILLSRLHFFLVKDPLLGSEGQNLTEENIFRECLTFQNEMEMQESKKELQGIKENFCTISVKDEEYFMLPVDLEFCKPSNSRSDSVKIPSYLELKELLNLAPETMADEDMCKDMIKEDLKAEITYKIEISKYYPMPQEACSSDSRSMLEFCESAKYVPYLEDKMEVPLTPPCRQQRSWVNFLCTGLQEEPIPLSDNSILITEPSREYLVSSVWQSEKYQDNMNSLLLVAPETVKLAYQRHSLTELKEVLQVEVEAPMLSSLEEGWWLHLGLNPVSIETLEQLNMDASSANSLLPTEVETFTQFTSYQLEGWLEEKNSLTNQDLLSAEKHQSDKVINLYMSPQTQSQDFALHMSPASSAKIHNKNTSVKELTRGSIKKNKVEEAIYFLNQEEKTPKSSESISCKDVSSKQDNSSSGQKSASFALATKWYNDSDLSNFIMLRSKCTLIQREEKNYVGSPEKVLQPEEQHMHVHKEDSSVCETVRKKEKESEDSVTVNIQASESQCQAYCLLEEAATPVLKDLTDLGILASVNWSFDSVKCDHTRFFLKQQEKVISDLFKEGKIDEKENMLFRHAALVHLLVTVRDLLLTCGLDTALGYLSEAKDIYKNILESCLNNIWRQLKIVQYSSQKKHETNPKITELQCQMLNWMQSCGEKHSVKILVIIRMDSEREKAALIHTLSRVEGLKAVDLDSEKKGTILGYKDIISNRYSCAIVHNQQIGADFPWTHFSLVMEYDYSENSCWKNMCKNLNVTYMTFKTILPETIHMRNHSGSFLLEVQIPYVFLTTEDLLNMPDILQLLESKYSIAFVERSSSYSLRLFGSTDRYVVLTIDECTAIFLQSMEELNYEKSCDNVLSKLMALSLQYTCCWIVFYSRERLSLEYSLRGDTLLNLVLIYATLIELTQKSEDFEVKVVLMPGIEETALVIRQIADNNFIASNISPHEWLDKSWLSVLPSETEKCLLTFPCINPLVAQFMLKKGSSLNRLFLASFDQLQELLPEVPKKVLKHFSDMTYSYSLNAAAPLETAVKGASPPENWSSFNTFYPDYKQSHQSLELLGKAQNSTGTSHMDSVAIIPPLNHHQDLFDSDLPSHTGKKSCSSEVITGRKQHFFAVPKDCKDFADLDVMNSLHVQRQPFRTHYIPDHFSKNSENEDFFVTFSDYAPRESYKSIEEEFRDTKVKSPEILIDQTAWNDSSSRGPCDSFASGGFLSHFFVDPDELQSVNFYQIGRESGRKRKQSPPFLWTKGKNRTDPQFAEAPKFKKRRLTYERVPGRRDGQTRLKLF
ncbi:protein shortage in chiasmata 1 ortholog [Aquila chrysaetos chrysaetos]|uniref:protein shortage in chiasmata 1 ortholog n=1 Tax=Aquila chrysaetos chrysaetos TaxID=223781 RepID=UPI001B7D41AF|nr:protein shortage in chiasmata 1 ortholog [Aquila chrysaetos chrysaetos]